MDQAVYKFPQGFWRVGARKFINKYEAYLFATEQRLKVEFCYFTHVWETFDRALLDKFTLKELYKQRAQQLRDSYDYLILYFSGGSDSYNVLRSFVDNGIKLDEVCVKWSTPGIESKRNIYSPNTTEKSAFNYASEWDYAVKPTLQWLADHHPEIKIEIVDWFKNGTSLEESFSMVNHWHDIELPSLAVWSPSENKLVGQGKTVGSIYGVDKPSIYLEDQNYYIRFFDSTLCMATPNPCNVYGVEYFYWSPKLPILAFEMANQIVKHYATNTEFQKYQVTADNWLFLENQGNDVYQFQETHHKAILYDTWDGRFQSDKPIKLDRTDKNFWIVESQELKKYKEEFQDSFDLRAKMLRSTGQWSLVDHFNDTRLYTKLRTKHFFLRRNE